MNTVLIQEPDSFRVRRPATYVRSDEMDEPIAELRADIRNLQIHVTDIKADVRATNARIDSLHDLTLSRSDSLRDLTMSRFDLLRDRIEQYRAEDRKWIEGRFDKLDGRFAKIDHQFVRIDDRFVRIDDRFAKVDDKFEQARKETKEEFKAVRGEMAALSQAMLAGFEKAREKSDSLQQQIVKTTKWAIGLYIAGTAGLVTAIIHGSKLF